MGLSTGRTPPSAAVLAAAAAAAEEEEEEEEEELLGLRGLARSVFEKEEEAELVALVWSVEEKEEKVEEAEAELPSVVEEEVVRSLGSRSGMSSGLMLWHERQRHALALCTTVPGSALVGIELGPPRLVVEEEEEEEEEEAPMPGGRGDVEPPPLAPTTYVAGTQ